MVAGACLLAAMLVKTFFLAFLVGSAIQSSVDVLDADDYSGITRLLGLDNEFSNDSVNELNKLLIESVDGLMQGGKIDFKHEFRCVFLKRF